MSTPSDQLISQEEYPITDAKGRKFIIRKPGLLAQFRLVEAAGESANIDRYMKMALPLIYVASINGEKMDLPINKVQLDALISTIGNEGLDAIGEVLKEHFSAPDPEADKAAIKK